MSFQYVYFEQKKNPSKRNRLSLKLIFLASDYDSYWILKTLSLTGRDLIHLWHRMKYDAIKLNPINFRTIQNARSFSNPPVLNWLRSQAHLQLQSSIPLHCSHQSNHESAYLSYR